MYAECCQDHMSSALKTSKYVRVSQNQPISRLMYTNSQIAWPIEPLYPH